jgi:hypothetical protein
MKIQTRRRIYLREAAVMLVLARLAVRILAPPRLFAWANRPLRRLQRFAAHEAGWIAWAVEDAGARMDAQPRALAAHAMLRRRGIASRLCLGVARQDGKFATQAWVESDGCIIGGGDARGFTRLAAIGRAS